jgi:hypothetical protein
MKSLTIIGWNRPISEDQLVRALMGVSEVDIDQAEATALAGSLLNFTSRDRFQTNPEHLLEHFVPVLAQLGAQFRIE